MASSVTNTLLTITMVTKESLRVLENGLHVAKHCNRYYEKSFAVSGAKINDVINVRKPPKYVGRDGQALQLEDSVETSVPFVLDMQKGVDIQFSSSDLALSIDEFAERFLKPAIANIANRIDSAATALYKQIWNSVGTPGTIPSQLITYLLAGVALDNNACPQDEQRWMFLTPLMQAYIVDALKGLFQQSSAIASQYMKGRMGKASGYEWFMDQNLKTHTWGTYSGVPLVLGANQTGTSLITNGWGVGVTSLNEGDYFTMAGVYGVNPASRDSTGVLQQFVVTQANTDTAGAMTLQIQPEIIVSGAFQTVTASPANGAAITMGGASGTVSPTGMLFHPDAITIASADLPVPRNVDMGARAQDPQLGFSMRIIRDYSIDSDQWPCRLDILFGAGMIRPELACRIAA